MKWLESFASVLANRVNKQLDDLTDKQDFAKAQDAFVAGDLSSALDGYERLAHRGHGRAAVLAGGMHINGQGTSICGPKAVMYFEIAKDAGDQEAIALLGMTYASGIPGVRVDYTKARPLLEAAVLNGDKDAQRMLDTIKNKRKVRR